MLFSVYIVFSLFSFTTAKQNNIILILTDDQDLLLNGMTPMKKTQEYLVNNGVIFQNAFVNAPICCPSRSSILTGQYPHNTEVKNNSYSGNCAGKSWQLNTEPKSVAVSLSESGYTNFYGGKYLNEYGTKDTGGVKHIPRGWHSWYALVGNSKYYNYTLSENGRAKRYNNEYLTDLLSSKAVKFIKTNSGPFFMVLAPPAPHAPFTPAERHIGKYPHVKALRTPSFNFTPKEKHWLVQMSPKHLPTNVEILDHIQQKRFESVMAVDDLVENVVQTLTEINKIDNTYLIFTSDNGFHIGQFAQPWDKRQPYDTDIRVPLLIRGPGIPKKYITQLAVQSIDLAPTILSMANITPPSYMDGESFLTKITSTHIEDGFKNILIEYHGEGNAHSNDPSCRWSSDNNLAECSKDSWCKCQDSRNNTYNCVRQLNYGKDFLFCRFSENFIEAYDMTQDLYQLKNLRSNMKRKEIAYYDQILKKLLTCKGSSCHNI